jgi:hypothetical protein
VALHAAEGFERENVLIREEGEDVVLELVGKGLAGDGGGDVGCSRLRLRVK